MTKTRLITFMALLAILTLAIIPVITGCSDDTTPTTTSEPTSSTPTATSEPTGSTPTASEPEPEPEPEETYELKWLFTNTGYEEGRWAYMGIQHEGWAAEVNYLTDGRVTFDWMIGAVTAPDMYDSLVMGAGDVANNVILLNTGRFPGLEVMTVPEMFTECARPSQVAFNLYQNFPEIQNEFSEVKIMSIYASTPTPPGIGFATIDEPIDTLEKCKGVKMGQYGLWSTKRTEALGFTPVAVPNPEVYEAIQRGLVDGSFMDTDFLTNQNVGELVNYWHPVGMLYCPFYFGLNWDTWNSLPPDIQKIMEEVAVNIPDWEDYYLTQDKKEILAEWPDLVTVEFTEEEKQRWRDATDPISLEYITMLDEKGYPGQAIYDEMMRLFEVYKDPLPESEIPAKVHQ